MNNKRTISGITATGKLTIGNYIGAIKSFVELQNEHELFVFVADLHALTIDITPEELAKNRQSILALYIACGLDPNKVTLFYQSHILAHTQLSWVFENMISIGTLSRMTQYKDKSQKNKQSNQTEKINTGLLTYPALMAADILLYNPSLVPVGEDQKQHLELTRDIGQKFNKRYGKTFIIPEIYTPKIGAKIMSLTNPTKKMSKSDNDVNSYIALLDKPEDAVKKIMKAVTDSENKIYWHKDKHGINNLLTIYASLNNIDLKTAENKFANYKNYAIFKQEIGATIKAFLESIQKKYYEILPKVDKIAAQGALKAKKIADEQLQIVMKKIGL